MALKPAPKQCACGKMIQAEWFKPVMINGSILPGTGKWYESTHCVSCEKEADVVRAGLAALDLWNKKLIAAGLDSKYLRGLDFDKVKTDTLPRKKIAEKMRELYKLAINGVAHNMFLSGNAGVGKTLFAVSFCKLALKNNSSAFFCPMPELLMELRNQTFKNRQQDEINRLAKYDVLCLDDLGAEKTTEWANESIYVIIDKWYRSEKQGLILTSNLKLGQIAERFGDRLASRLAGMCKTIDFEGCHDGRIE